MLLYNFMKGFRKKDAYQATRNIKAIEYIYVLA